MPESASIQNFGFRIEFTQLFQRGLSSGTLSIKEIAAAIPSDIKADKEALVQTLDWLLNYLGQMNVNIVSADINEKLSKILAKDGEKIEFSVAQTLEEEKSEDVLGQKMFSLFKMLSVAKKTADKKKHIELRNQIVKRNLNLSQKVSFKYAFRMANEPRELAIEREDLCQEGNIGLIKATDRFDHLRGNRYSTYAYWWIDQYMNRFFCCNGRIIDLPIRVHDDIKRVRETRDVLRNALSYEPTHEEILQKLGWSQERLDAVFDAMRFDKASLSLDDPVSGADNGDKSLLLEEIVVPDPSSELVYDIDDQFQSKIEREIYQFQLRKGIKIFLSKAGLSEREKDFFEKHFGLGESAEEWTLQKIADGQGGLSRERVRQIINKALTKIMASDELKKLALLYYGERDDINKIVSKVNQIKATAKKEIEQKGWMLENEISIGHREGTLSAVKNKMQILENLPEYLRMISILNSSDLSAQSLIQKTGYFFGFDEQSLASHARHAPLVLVRQIVMYVLREYKKLSFTEIARLLKKEDRATVIHGYKKIKKHIKAAD